MNAMNTHYPEPVRVEAVNRHTLAVVVDNEPGALRGSRECSRGGATTSRA